MDLILIDPYSTPAQMMLVRGCRRLACLDKILSGGLRIGLLLPAWLPQQWVHCLLRLHSPRVECSLQEHKFQLVSLMLLENSRLLVQFLRRNS